MVKFLLGVVSGGLLVTGGLVVSSMLFPTEPANDNAGVAPADKPSISAPAPAAADAGKTVAAAEDAAAPKAEDAGTTAVAQAAPAETETAPAETADAEPAAAAPATETAATDAVTEPDTAGAETASTAPDVAEKTAMAETEAAAPAAAPEAEAAPATDTAAEAAAPAPEAEKPVVADALPTPAAPQDEAAVADAGAPAAAEVTTPETAAEPSKPADAVADAAAVAPDPAPAAEPAAPAETVTADVGTPAPAPAEPAPAPAESAATDAAPTETATAEPAPALAAPDAAPADEPAPTKVAEAAPAAEPAPTEVAETAPADVPAPTELAEAAPATTEVAEAAPAETQPITETPAASETATEPAPATAAPEAEPGPAEDAPVVQEPALEVMPATPEETTEPEVKLADATPGQDVPDMPGTKPAGLPDAEVGMITPDTPIVEGKGPTFKLAPGLTAKGEGVVIKRGNEAEPAPAESDAAAAPPADTRPIAAYATPFENPEAKPPFAIVLIDDGRADLDRAGLAALPLPVSIALNPLDPATPDRAAGYRAAGKEVVMLVTGIAQGAQASDVEVAFQSMAQGLPEAVAVLDLAEPAFQNNRVLASAVVPILKAQGRGLLTWDAGLNAADQVARREDLEAAVVFRDLDQAKGDQAGMRRLLDRAVFKAGQEGRVAVVGTADADLLAGLLEWSVEGKAATVAVAPLTAILKVD